MKKRNQKAAIVMMACWGSVWIVPTDGHGAARARPFSSSSFLGEGCTAALGRDVR